MSFRKLLNSCSSCRIISGTNFTPRAAAALLEAITKTPVAMRFQPVINTPLQARWTSAIKPPGCPGCNHPVADFSASFFTQNPSVFSKPLACCLCKNLGGLCGAEQPAQTEKGVLTSTSLPVQLNDLPLKACCFPTNGMPLPINRLQTSKNYPRL